VDAIDDLGATPDVRRIRGIVLAAGSRRRDGGGRPGLGPSDGPIGRPPDYHDVEPRPLLTR
jgi:hypothetical protein